MNGDRRISEKKERIAHLNSTVCYLKQDDKVLMIKFNKKWGQVYAPPGGKFETGESPLFKKEIFEGKFLLDENCNVIKYEIRTI